jgi:glycosyltransferase involved in cell wall biosynthesis
MKKAYWFVMPWDPRHPGGVANVVLNLYKHFARHDYSPSILVASWEDISFRWVRQDGIDCCHVRLLYPIADGWVGKLAYWLRLPGLLIRLTKVLRKENVVCINPHYPNDSALSFVLLRKLGGYKGRILLSFHGTDFDDIEKVSGYGLLIWRLILSDVDAVITCSHALAKRVLAKFPEIEAKTHAALNGFDLDEFERDRDQASNLPQELTNHDFILNVAAYEHKKGHDILLRAFKQLTVDFPMLKLALVGGGNSAYDKIMQWIVELGLVDKVTVIRELPHTKIAPYFENARIFALPSRKEPFGLVLLEAGAFGLPVIASRVGGIPEIISSPDLGVLVEPEDHEALASALRSVLNEPGRAKSMGANLRQHVLANFSWAATVDTYLSLLGPKQ